MSIALKTTEYSAWVHSLNFVDDTTNINTWVDWHLVPMSRPLVNAPKMKTCIVDIPGADGQIDLSTVVSGKPVYSNRTGSWEFMVQNGWKPNQSFTVTISDDDAFADYLSHISFSANGGSVTSHGLDGDTEFKFEVYVKKIIYEDGGVGYDTSIKLTTRNLVTGQEYVKNTNAYSSSAGKPAHRVKITDVSVSSTAVEIKFDFINGSTGDVINYKTVRATVDSVGGTSFRGEKDWWSSVTQNSDNISCAYDTASWSTMFSLIMNTLNGKTMKVLLDNESVLDPETNTYSPSWYYEGLITIDNWKTGDKYSTITIAYDLKPYKYSYDDPTIKSL